MKPDELPLATLDGYRVALTLAAPCHCGRQPCTLGVHLWHATRDMTPGIPAHAYEPRTLTPSGPPSDADPRPDPTALAHQRYNQLLAGWQQASLELLRFVEGHRPDRWVPPPDVVLTDEHWCANHLTNFGTCEIRHRGDLCRWCDDIRRLHGFTPDPTLMRARHVGARITDHDIADAKKRTGRNTQKRRKAG